MNACDRLEPDSTLPLMSIMSREKRALLWPRATISKHCRSGTPALSIVASWRVNIVTSFSVIFLPPRNVCRFILVTRMPCRRRLVRSTVSEAARASPCNWRALRSTPSQTKTYSFTSRRCCRAAVAIAFPLLVRNGFDLFQRGDSGLHLQKTGLPEVANAFLACLCRNVDRRSVAHDDEAHLIGDRHHFVDA